MTKRYFIAAPPSWVVHTSESEEAYRYLLENRTDCILRNRHIGGLCAVITRFCPLPVTRDNNSKVFSTEVTWKNKSFKSFLKDEMFHDGTMSSAINRHVQVVARITEVVRAVAEGSHPDLKRSLVLLAREKYTGKPAMCEYRRIVRIRKR
jgi:hypothetical protein